MCFHHLGQVSEQVCHSQVLTAPKYDFPTFHSKSLNHSLYFTFIMYKIVITNVFLRLQTARKIRNANPFYLTLHALLFKGGVLEHTVMALQCHKGC